ncbi:MAG: DUF3828 domain-containing protein [Gammaproteobacteria bacterium]|nr:DUF3828 domain-containing protein [Gammaproteobacteria bacterium]
MTSRAIIANWLASAAVFSVVAAPVFAGDGPEDRVKAFYAAYFSGSKSGLPTVEEMAGLSVYLSHGLVRLIEDARAEQRVFMAEHPDEKPPWIEGDLFSSLFEGPSDFAVGAADTGADKARVSIRFTYTDPADAEATVAWEDAVILRKEGGRWLIDDVLFLADWEFKPGAALRAVLGEGAE